MQTITKRPFSTCPMGDIDCITLDSGNGLSVDVLTLGATLRAVTITDSQGNATDVALGYDTATQYQSEKTYTGACIGRYANRIGNATFPLNGQVYQVTANQDNGHQLHGGQVGYDKQLWHCDIQDACAVFSHHDPHLHEGYPGAVDVTITFSISADNTLTITYDGQTDRPTVMNLTHHPYFNLNGHGAGLIDDHMMRLNASYYTPADDAGIPNGEIRHVAGTPLDFQGGHSLAPVLNHPDLAVTRGLDHNFVLGHNANAPFGWVWSKTSRIGMALSTTLPGVQVYTAGFYTDQTGKGGVQYHSHHSVALEPQFFPNSPNYAHFPSTTITLERPYHHTISYQFFSNVNW